MHIVIVVPDLQVGGAQTQAVRLAIELAARGHAVRVVALGVTGPNERRLLEHGLPVEIIGYRGIGRDASGRVRPRRLLEAIARLVELRRAVVRGRPDVVQTYLFWPSALALPMAAIAGVSVRVACRRALVSRAEAPRWIRASLERVINRSASAVIANSRAVATAAAGTAGAAHTSITIIPNGVDLPEVTANASRQPPTVVSVANLFAFKGPIDLVRAAVLLPAGVTVRMIGDGPERDAVCDEIRRLGLERTVRLEGHTDAHAARAGAQIAVLASHEEGLPNAVLEAMAAGLPVVATAVGGTRELVTDGVTGLLVPPCDPAALGHALAELAATPERRVAMGRAGRERVQELTWDRCVRRHLELYEEQLRGTAPVA